ncbi:MAG TPA: YdcF family protein [Candidatus Nanoarchaeia archaeon]|nr:YdcF family protein [Candidatus Nanoarchaeia archaeon]
MKKNAENKVIVVLGYKTEGKSIQTLESRLDTTIKFSIKNRINKICLSGGKSRNTTEAEAMKTYLKEKVKGKQLITEKKSKDTLQNAVFSRRIIDKMRAGTIIIVTSYLHAPRAKLIFKKIFKNHNLIFVPSEDKKSFFQNISIFLKEKLLTARIYFGGING